MKSTRQARIMRLSLLPLFFVPLVYYCQELHIY